MDTGNNIIDPSIVIKTRYEKKAKFIKAYLARRYNTDAEWRDMVNKQRAVNQSLKYNSDPEHRAKILQRRREAYQAKKQSLILL